MMKDGGRRRGKLLLLLPVLHVMKKRRGVVGAPCSASSTAIGDLFAWGLYYISRELNCMLSFEFILIFRHGREVTGQYH